MNERTRSLLLQYRNELNEELEAILAYWSRYTIDQQQGGFVGRIAADNRIIAGAAKGSVLNARILWTFSWAYKHTRDPQHLRLATRAFNYLCDHLIDPLHGGVFWSVDASGQPLEEKKQVYAQAFAIYGCAAYYRASGEETARQTAIDLYRLIEQHSYDPVHGGYLEALSRNWQPLDDLRLSARDANEKKTMNTHLHVLEAYGLLYVAWQDEGLAASIRKLVNNFQQHIIDRSGHLRLFFDEAWQHRSPLISFGHDIEAAWLLPEAAAYLMDSSLTETVTRSVEPLANKVLTAIDADGGMRYEYDPVADHWDADKHWWVQAEAMVGFFDQFQRTGLALWLDHSWQSWQYVRAKIIDTTYGEWLWGRHADGTEMEGEDKVGIWKCPYHNGRACLEIIHRIDQLLPIA